MVVIQSNNVRCQVNPFSGKTRQDLLGSSTCMVSANGNLASTDAVIKYWGCEYLRRAKAVGTIHKRLPVGTLFIEMREHGGKD